jgi:hypothetical protein
MRTCLQVATALVFAAASTGCILPIVSPGVRADVGGAVGASAGQVRPAVHATLGLSTASVVPPSRGPPVDLGLGYVIFAPTSGRAPVQGGYLDAAWLRQLSAGWRLSLGGRAELLTSRRWDDAPYGRGAALRVSLEKVRFGKGPVDATFDECVQRLGPRRAGDPPTLPGEPPGTEYDCPPPSFAFGSYFGNSGFGLAAEYGLRQLPGAGTSSYAMVGLSFRLPAAAFLLFGFPRSD